MAGAALSRPRASSVVPAALILFGSVALIACVTYLSTRTSFAGAKLLGLGLFAALTAWMACTKHTLWALGGVLLYVGLLDGVLKLMADNELPTIGRDVLLYAVVLGLGVRAKLDGKRFVLPVFGGFTAAWVIIVLVQLGNPGNGTWAHSIASLRQHLEFVPLLFIGFHLLREERHLRMFLGLLLLIAAINGAVGTYQSTLSPDQLASWGTGYSNLINGVGSAPRTSRGADGEKRVRPPGLGSDMGFAGVLGATAIPAGLALLLMSRRRKADTLLIVLGLVGAAAGVLTSQSRSALITAIIAVVAFILCVAVAGQAGRSILALVAVGVVAIGAVYTVGSRDSEAFYRYQTITPGKALGTTLESRASTWELIPEYASEVPLGAGIGSVGPAAGLWDNRQTKYNAESQFTFLIVEVGIPGFLIFLVFQAVVFFCALRGLRWMRGDRRAVLLAAVVAPLFAYAVNWLVGVNTVSSPNAPYLWLAIGIIGWWLVARPREERRELRDALNAPAADRRRPVARAYA